jgi:uncharacterized protein YndB with AHSA1/START domain
MPAENEPRDDAFEISRNFDAPRELVWRAWTEPQRVAAWFGPKGSGPTRVIRHELRPGGVFLSSQVIPGGQEIWGKHVYREVVPISRLVWVHSFSDEHGALARHPLNPTWPLELLTTVTFDDLGARTRVTLQWMPINASEAERKTFSDARPGMQVGWTGSFEQLGEVLLKD